MIIGMIGTACTFAGLLMSITRDDTLWMGVFAFLFMGCLIGTISDMGKKEGGF